MLDLTLLHSFVSVVDAGGFTRASTRVHRTQSTISQQVKRLEEIVGRTLLSRESKSVTLTEDGERLLGYARRILALASEARDIVRHEHDSLRLGVTEDFAACTLPGLLSDLSRTSPKLKFSVHCAYSSALRDDLEQGNLDLILVKRDVAEGGAVHAWPEQLTWVVGAQFRGDLQRDPLPLIVFGQACLYHNRSLHALEAAGRSWRIVLTTPNTPGVQAAVSAGLGIAILPEPAVLAGHRRLTRRDGFPTVRNTELALLMAPNAAFGVRELAGRITDFCCAHLMQPQEVGRRRGSSKTRQSVRRDRSGERPRNGNAPSATPRLR